jgi:murein DD-endopeptidase MepM/ murein hydrolase activator NlpD
MSNKKFILFSGIVLIMLAGIMIGAGYYFKSVRKQVNPSAPNTNVPSSNNSPAPTSTNPAAENNTAAPAAIATVTYPIDNFDNRVSSNPFGNYLSGKSSANPDAICPTSTKYVGYHTGTDLETTSSELNVDVPVKSIADGTVRQIGPVTGYGGLIVIEYTINRKTYTAYFGHIDLRSSNLKAGDHVKLGEQIADLGSECSSSNGFTRKHLHFGMRPGTSIDVRGYVPDTTTLKNWVNGKDLLDSLIKQ